MSKNRPTTLTSRCFLRGICLHVFMCMAIVIVAGSAAAQNNRTVTVSINVSNEPFIKVIEQLRQQSGYEFVFNSADVSKEPSVTLSLSSTNLRAALIALFRRSDLTWSIEDRTVIIKKDTAKTQQSRVTTLVTGTVKDASGSPIPGVSIIVKGTTNGVSTDINGNFRMLVLIPDIVLHISFLGMETQEIAWAGQPLNVVMQEQAKDIEEVIVTGIFTRRAESSTGSHQVFDRKDLSRIGGLNVIQKLGMLDPAFNVVESFANGSNPNAMPEIMLRGQSDFPDMRGEYSSNPNQPLFILDGFEVNLTKVMDMDMSRIESVTILKDAAAKAIYGSKAANGVVVIETHRPQVGEMRVTYTGTLSVQGADLSSYNLTNAAEKLQVEKAAGVYIASHDKATASQYKYDLMYNEILEEVLRGVNTDWISKPVRTGIGQKQVLYLEGGNDKMTYGIDFSYHNIAGAMKGSDRNTISGGMTFSYRYKNVLFRNNLEATHNKGTNSPYGQFSEYARMNPYHRTTDENGNIIKVAGQKIVGLKLTDITNPLWNTTINTKDFTEYTQLTDNLYVEWRTGFGLKAIARGNISRTDKGHEIFHPARHTDFHIYDTEELKGRRGQYTYGDGEDFSFSADVNANYSQLFGKHFVFGNIGWSISDEHTRYTTFVAEGFPNDYLEDITFARQYLKDGSPTGTENRTRNVGILGAVNYSYCDRYLFDGSFRMSASSQFGRDKRWGKFWSLGVGWNLHNESFMKNSKVLNLLKIRASIGFSGSQNFNSYQSKATYSYNSSTSYLGGYGAYLLGIENPSLRWQRKFDQNIGFDAGLFNNTLTAKFDYYVSNTDDLLTDVTIPSSTGFRSYKENLGEIQNKGIEAKLNYRVWHNPKKGNFVNVYVAATHNINKVRKISNSLASYNESQEANPGNRPVVRYIEGQSLNVIWAMRSYGIDPATGRDILVRPDGVITFDWDSNYLVACGDTEPKLKGTCGFNVDYNGFSLNVAMSWMFGGQIYNQTVVDKVENADVTYNVDRRVFSNRWYKPGDVSRFKNISDRSITYATQRFVEDRNEWSLSSVNLSYDLNRVIPVRRIGMSRLRLSFDMNDIARVSSVKIERGTSYPFARTFSFSLQSMF